MYTLKNDFLYDIDDLADVIRPRRKTLLDRLVGRMAVGQINGGRFLYEVHGPYATATPEPARRPLIGRLIERLSAWLRETARQIRLRRAANEMHRLDDRMLNDIGITRSQIDAAISGEPIRGRYY
jgi:uncharacterized protein YjiS (DUF1127 family)